MDVNPQLMQQLQFVFKTELKEHLQTITSGLLSLEQEGNKERQQRIIEEIFRAAHSLKGAAKGVSQHQIAEIIHPVESIFSLIKKSKLDYSKTLFDTVLNALDKINVIASEKREITSSETKLILEQLNHFLKTSNEQKTQPENLKHSTSTQLIFKKQDDFSFSPKAFEEENSIEVFERDDIIEEQNSYTVLSEDVSQLSTIAEELQTVKLKVKQHLNDFYQLCSQLDDLTGHFNDFSSKQLESVVYQKIAQNSNELSFITRSSFNKFNQLRQLNSHLQHLSQDLNDNINRIRLVPFSILLAPLQRIVRDLSQQQQKQINFHIEGGDNKIDRHLYQVLHSPLLHLVNNAIDHGIETAEERNKKNKKNPATLSLKINKTGQNITLIVADDGKGIDIELIKEKLLKQNKYTKEEINAFTQEALIDFIFTPEFSLAKIVTDISGRGVGLDVVRTNLHKIKGNIKVTTKENDGTEFILTLPASLSSETGLLILLGQQKFALQSYNISWVEMITPQQILFINGKSFLQSENRQPVAIYYLAQLMQLEGIETAKDNLNCVIIGNGHNEIALVVDDILGEQDLIIKPFSYPLLRVPFAIGVTNLGNGDLIPVLDVSHLIAKALSEQPRLKIDKKDTEVQKVLIADDSSTSRTLEKNILQQYGFQVSTFINGLEAWKELEKNQDYDLIITDVEMPFMDGFELIEKLKKHVETELIPTIIVSSLNSEEDKRRGIKVGADAYITKDLFDSEKLLTIINQLL